MMFFAILYGLPKISNVHLLYSFLYVFIRNSITKYFTKLKKNSIICVA